MYRLARVRRLNQQGIVEDAAINPTHVRYVYSHSPGSYIAFHDAHNPESRAVTPIGVHSPDPINVVIKNLDRSYWIDMALRVWSPIAAAAGAVLVLLFS